MRRRDNNEACVLAIELSPADVVNNQVREGNAVYYARTYSDKDSLAG